MASPRQRKLRCVRLHSSGRYRAVVTIEVERIIGPLRATPEEALQVTGARPATARSPQGAAHGASLDAQLQGLRHANLRQTQRYYHSQATQSRDAMRSVGERLCAYCPAAEQPGGEQIAQAVRTGGAS